MERLWFLVFSCKASLKIWRERIQLGPDLGWFVSQEKSISREEPSPTNEYDIALLKTYVLPFSLLNPRPLDEDDIALLKTYGSC